MQDLSRRLNQDITAALTAEIEEWKTDLLLDSTMSITGAKFLGESIRAQVAAAKRTIAEAGADVGSAVGEINDAAAAAGKFAKAMRAEADELKAEIGQFTNGAPDDEPKVDGGPY